VNKSNKLAQWGDVGHSALFPDKNISGCNQSTTAGSQHWFTQAWAKVIGLDFFAANVSWLR
jgi:hypothetical protein